MPLPVEVAFADEPFWDHPPDFFGARLAGRDGGCPLVEILVEIPEWVRGTAGMVAGEGLP